jgi:hypothetical protein
VDDPDSRIGLVPVLAPLAVPSVSEDFEVLVGNIDLDLALLVEDSKGRG